THLYALIYTRTCISLGRLFPLVAHPLITFHRHWQRCPRSTSPLSPSLRGRINLILASGRSCFDLGFNHRIGLESGSIGGKESGKIICFGFRSLHFGWLDCPLSPSLSLSLSIGDTNLDSVRCPMSFGSTLVPLFRPSLHFNS